MKLKNTTIEDCAFIATLFDNDEYQNYFAENDTTKQDWGERFPLFADCENKIVFDNDKPVGWITYQLKESICEIGIIVIKHNRIGSGIGYDAFHTVISSLPSYIKTVILDVQQKNCHAVSFYKRYGFQIIGEEKQPVGDHEELYYNMEFQRFE